MLTSPYGLSKDSNLTLFDPTPQVTSLAYGSGLTAGAVAGTTGRFVVRAPPCEFSRTLSVKILSLFEPLVGIPSPELETPVGNPSAPVCNPASLQVEAKDQFLNTIAPLSLNCSASTRAGALPCVPTAPGGTTLSVSFAFTQAGMYQMRLALGSAAPGAAAPRRLNSPAYQSIRVLPQVCGRAFCRCQVSLPVDTNCGLVVQGDPGRGRVLW